MSGLASSNLNSGKTPEYDDGSIDQGVNPVRNLAVGDEGEVALGLFQVVCNDDPGGHDWEPAPRKIVHLRFHLFGACGCCLWLCL